jgi:hypothetical protein
LQPLYEAVEDEPAEHVVKSKTAPTIDPLPADKPLVKNAETLSSVSTNNGDATKEEIYERSKALQKTPSLLKVRKTRQLLKETEVYLFIIIIFIY